MADQDLVPTDQPKGDRKKFVEQAQSVGLPVSSPSSAGAAGAVVPAAPPPPAPAAPAPDFDVFSARVPSQPAVPAAPPRSPLDELEAVATSTGNSVMVRAIQRARQRG